MCSPAQPYRLFGLLALAAMAYLLSGCELPPPPSYSLIELERANSRLQEQAQQIRTVAILPSEVKVYQIDAGDVREEIAEWSAQARTNVVNALENELRAKMKTVVKVVSGEYLAEKKTRLEETRALYDAVLAMILLHTNPDFPRHFFEEKVQNFDYSLGTEVGSLANGADALLLFYAQDYVGTAGHQALQALGNIVYIGLNIATVGIFALEYWLKKRVDQPVSAMLSTGENPRRMTFSESMSGGSGVRAALVDSGTGDILWINAVGSGAGTDLRDPASARAMVDELFKDFPVSYDRQPKEQKSR
jgi:hypothetical protein